CPLLGVKRTLACRLHAHLSARSDLENRKNLASHVCARRRSEILGVTPGRRPGLKEIPAARPIMHWVDRLNAIRLLQALVAAGAKTRAPMDSAWVHKIAVRDMSLESTALASAIAYAVGEGWLADSSRKGWISLTRTGEFIARVK